MRGNSEKIYIKKESQRQKKVNQKQKQYQILGKKKTIPQDKKKFDIQEP